MMGFNMLHALLLVKALIFGLGGSTLCNVLQYGIMDAYSIQPAHMALPFAASIQHLSPTPLPTLSSPPV